jgi:hypothetical protein
MRLMKKLMIVLAFVISPILAAQNIVHVWEKQELTFNAVNSYKNHYTDVNIWVDLTGTCTISSIAGQ